MTLFAFHPASLNAVLIGLFIYPPIGLMMLFPFFGLPGPSLWVSVAALGGAGACG